VRRRRVPPSLLSRRRIVAAPLTQSRVCALRCRRISRRCRRCCVVAAASSLLHHRCTESLLCGGSLSPGRLSSSSGVAVIGGAPFLDAASVAANREFVLFRGDQLRATHVVFLHVSQ
jgi:hypothetical protein